MNNSQRQAVYGLCRYRRSTLARLTDQCAYEQARTGNYQFDSSDARGCVPVRSEAMLQDCQLSPQWAAQFNRTDPRAMIFATAA